MSLPVSRRVLPPIGKFVSLVLVFVVLAVALVAVRDIVAEREGRLREAQQSVSASLAASQQVVGPVLGRQCIETWDETHSDDKGKRIVTVANEFFFGAAPETLDVDAVAATEQRYRGIFKVNAYLLKAHLVATWAAGSGGLPQPSRPDARVTCKAPVIHVALGDARGIRNAAATVDAASTVVRPGTGGPAHPNGFHVDLAEGSIAAGRPLAAEFKFEVVGTGGLDIAPVGMKTQVRLASDWPHPSFTGRFLPAQKSIDETGFTAVWTLDALATSAPLNAERVLPACSANAAAQGFEGAAATRITGCVETFGVDFIDPVNPYTLSDRATKYGLLFIALTFVGVAMLEVMRRVRVHPVQYLLVGAALATFFLLLVSLSEHVAFGLAYAIAASACTVLLAFYGSFVLGGVRAGAAFGAAIAALYGTLYLLLQLEQTALLLGSILLFVVLAGVMAATRKIDWYALVAGQRKGPADALDVPDGSTASA